MIISKSAPSSANPETIRSLVISNCKQTSVAAASPSWNHGSAQRKVSLLISTKAMDFRSDIKKGNSRIGETHLDIANAPGLGGMGTLETSRRVNRTPLNFTQVLCSNMSYNCRGLHVKSMGCF